MATGLELGCKRSLAAAPPQLGVPFRVTSPSASWPRPPQPPAPAAVERWHSQVPGSLFPPTQFTDPGEGQAGPDGVGLVSVSALPRSGSKRPSQPRQGLRQSPKANVLFLWLVCRLNTLSPAMAPPPAASFSFMGPSTAL